MSTLTSIECRDAIQRGTVLKAKSRGCNATLLVDNLDSGQILEQRHLQHAIAMFKKRSVRSSGRRSLAIDFRLR